MPRVAWLTDLHLNFVEEAARFSFYDELQQLDVDAFLLSGDVGEAASVTKYLGELDSTVQRPLYFVLGNHDFYFGSIDEVRRRVSELCAQRPQLVYLTEAGVQPLSDQSALVGHDGWADARIGDYERSYVMMNDYRLIQELAGISKQERWPRLQALGDAAAEATRLRLEAAFETHPRAVLLTHVPPWREACWHEGHLSDDEWAPHFTCQAMGHMVEEVMRARPDCEVTVLCGHTHSSGQAQIADNIRVWTAGAVYGQPALHRVLELE